MAASWRGSECVNELPASRVECIARDEDDPLGAIAERFFKPQGIIYLAGNSLGPLPKAAVSRLEEVIEQEWGRDLITSWNKEIAVEIDDALRLEEALRNRPKRI